jgi:hypothetical protein
MTNIAPGKGGIERDPMTLANHRFFAGSLEEMLKQCLKVKVHVRHDAGTTRVETEVLADGVGHRVPTGFVDRNLLLVLEALAAEDQPLGLRDGPKLPQTAGKDLEQRAGRVYARQLRDFDGKAPAPFWRADPAHEDTRLRPGKPDRLAFTFAGTATAVRVRVLYRRFWHEVAVAKRWPDNEIIVLDERINLAPGARTSWQSR